ncbi:hypothetical protein MKS88_004529 [Plasmodium brasilianum]|uniref:Uncharacterized protein n=1 Tax=Plasmodium brasilianum TaxID=5824 RepID=A0ACB9Y6I2_PLABR|nr:hypothetical protein MKS88_004529 [Plasmodium brasilianum]
MASSQIRQFATLIDQLPCEADDFNLMENFEDYSKCFEGSIHANNLKSSDSFFSFNSNLSDYISNISKSQLNIKCSKINGKNISNSSNKENEKSVLENTINSRNKTNEKEILKNFNVNNLIKSESNKCTNINPIANDTKEIFFDENYINKNQNHSNFNSLFVHANDLKKEEKSNYIELLNSDTEGTYCKYGINKRKSLCKNSRSEVINRNNEYLTDINFSNNNKNNEDISLYTFNDPYNDKTCEDNEENIVYRYSINMLSSKNESCNNEKNVDKFKIGSSVKNKVEKIIVDEPSYSYKNIASSGAAIKENTQNVLYNDKKNGNNERNREHTNNSNLNNFLRNSNIKKINKNVNVKISNNDNSTVIDYKDFYNMLKKSDDFNKNILLSKKAKVIKLDSNKSLVIFPVNMNEYGDKYIAVNQKDLLEYISSSIEIDNEDLSSLKIKNYQKEKELQNIKTAYSMQTTNIHYLINRVIFKECEYENLKNKSLTLEQEINKLIQEINSLISQNKEGLFMQKEFIDYKCKCILKLQELQPLLGKYYFDIFTYITSCRTLGQLSIWIPAFQKKNDSLETIANNLIKILLSGLGAPINSCPQYFLYNKKLLKKSISIESEEDTFINNLAKRKIIDNYLVNNLNSFNTTKENNSHFSNSHSLSFNSESSSLLGTEELFFNSSKFPSMHSVILKNCKDQSKKEKYFNKLNRSNTTPEHFYINNESYCYSNVYSNKNKQDICVTNIQDEKKLDNGTMLQEKQNIVKRKQSIPNDEEKEIKKIRFNGKMMNTINLERDNNILTTD